MPFTKIWEIFYFYCRWNFVFRNFLLKHFASRKRKVCRKNRSVQQSKVKMNHQQFFLLQNVYAAHTRIIQCHWFSILITTACHIMLSSVCLAHCMYSCVWKIEKRKNWGNFHVNFECNLFLCFTITIRYVKSVNELKSTQWASHCSRLNPIKFWKIFSIIRSFLVVLFHSCIRNLSSSY